MNDEGLIHRAKKFSAKEKFIYKQWIFRKPLQEISQIAGTSIEDVSGILSDINKTFDSFEKTMDLLAEIDNLRVMTVPR